MPGLAGYRIAVDRALAQNVEDNGQHQQREDRQTPPLVGEDDKDDVLKHDQHAEKAEDQQVQHIMHAADALLLLAVVGVDIRPPVGRKPGLNGCYKLRKAVAEGKKPLRTLAAGVADKRKADTAGQAEQNLRRGQRDAVGHGLPRNAAQLCRGQRCQHGTAILVPERNGHHAEAEDGGDRQHKDLGGEKARQQIKQVVAALHPERFRRVGAQVVFQPKQDIQIPYQHIERCIEKEQRHDARPGGAKAERGGEGLRKKHTARNAQQHHKGRRDAGAGRKQLARLGPGGRLMVKAQQGLIQPKDADIHDGGRVGHEGDRCAQHLGGQQPLDDKGQPRDGEAQIGRHRIFHYIPGEGFTGRFFVF